MVKSSSIPSVLDVAREEFQKKVIPIAVLREFPDGHVERVEVS